MAEQTAENTQQPAAMSKQDIQDAADELNLRIWNAFPITDVAHTQKIEGKTYKGTSIRPHFIIRELTRVFGPVGFGWGYRIISEECRNIAPNEVLNVVRLELWYKLPGSTDEKIGTIEQFGQTRMYYMSSGGKPILDEDAPKKSVTDALTKCASIVGVCHDIYLNQWDEGWQKRAKQYYERAEQRKRERLQRETSGDAAAKSASGNGPPVDATPKQASDAVAKATPDYWRRKPLDHELADFCVQIDASQDDEFLRACGGAVLAWFKNGGIPTDRAEKLAKEIAARRAQVVKIDRLTLYKQMLDAFVTRKLLTAQQSSVYWESARSRLNVVDP